MLRKTVVILHPGGLGDLLLAVPAVGTLRTRFPAHDVLVCGHREGAYFLAECGLAERALAVDSTPVTALFGGRSPEDRLLLDWLGRCNFAVAWTSDRSGMLTAALQRSGAAVAVVQSPFSPTLTRVHQAERYAEIAGIQSEQVLPLRVPVPDGLKDQAAAYLADCGVRPEQPMALIHPGSGSAHKCVKPHIMVPLLEGLKAEGLVPLLLQGPADGEIIEELLLHMPRRPAVVRQLPLRLLAGVLSQADVFIGHDSGVTHLAALVGTPTVALFGPTAPARWAPRGPAVTVIQGKPCGCLSWDAVRRCADKPCLEFSPSALLQACATTRRRAEHR